MYIFTDWLRLGESIKLRVVRISQRKYNIYFLVKRISNFCVALCLLISQHLWIKTCKHLILNYLKGFGAGWIMRMVEYLCEVACVYGQEILIYFCIYNECINCCQSTMVLIFNLILSKSLTSFYSSFPIRYRYILPTNQFDYIVHCTGASGFGNISNLDLGVRVLHLFLTQ